MTTFRLLFSTLSIFFLAHSHAAERTVDNRAGAIAQFSSIQEAIDAAADGDTIKVAGSAQHYGSINLNKRIKLVGPGNALNLIPQGQTANGRLVSILSISFTEEASGSELMGLNIGGTSSLNGIRGRSSQMKFLNCEIRQNTTGSSVLTGTDNEFIGCYTWGSTLLRNAERAVFVNCLISRNPGVQRLSCSNCVIDYPWGSDGSQFSSCIFTTSGGLGDLGNRTFLNCLSFTDFSDRSFASAGTNNIGPEGITGADYGEKFAAVFVENYNQRTPDFYRLNQVASNPAVRTLSDPTDDLGLYGGLSLFTASGSSHIPTIKYLHATPAVTPQTGLRLEVHAVAPTE